MSEPTLHFNLGDPVAEAEHPVADVDEPAEVAEVAESETAEEPYDSKADLKDRLAHVLAVLPDDIAGMVEQRVWHVVYDAEGRLPGYGLEVK